MITQKIAFHLLKVLEIFALRYSTGKKVNTYDLIAVSQSSLGHNTLIIAADWIFSTRHKDTLSEINTLLIDFFYKNINLNEFKLISFDLEKKNINSEIDILINSFKQSEQLNTNTLSYFLPFRVSTEQYQEGFTLHSRVLPNFSYDQKVIVTTPINRVAQTEILTPVAFNAKNNDIIFTTEAGTTKEINLYKIWRTESPFISEFGF
jgi:hypothetical protein